MEKSYPKISVIIICYNQEDVISRAIDSLLIQKEYFYELIISDDCSTDNTWSIIEDYQKKYPDIVKAYRQEVNQGVYENLQSTYDKVTGEMVFFLSGDDESGPELFKKTCETVNEKNLDYKKDRFCVITDFKVIANNGKERIIKKNALVNKYNPFSLKYRGIITNRALGESITTFRDRKHYIERGSSPIPTSLQEGYTDIMPFVYTKDIFYIPYAGNTYYAGIGVATRFIKYREEYLKGLIEYCEKAPDYFDSLNRFDKNWLSFHKAKTEFLLNPMISNYGKYFIMFFKLAQDPLRKYFLSNEIKRFIKTVKLLFQ